MQKYRRKLGQYLCKKRYSLVIPLLMVLCACFCMFTDTTSALTTVPTKTNFQGRLTNSAGNIMADGTYNMKFRLFTASSGGSSVWNEDRLVSASQGVQVTNGLFSVRLGDVTAIPASLFASGTLYFEIELPTPGTATSSSPSWTEGAMTPRNQLATSAYAYNSETLDGLDSADFGQITANNTWTGTQAFNGSTVSIGGTANAAKFNVASLFNIDSSASIVSVGASDTTGTVLVLDTKTGSGDPTGASAVGGAMYYNSNAGKFRCYQNGAWRDCTSALQDAYDLSANSATVPEIKIDSTRGSLDIQDKDTTAGVNILNVRAANGSGLGTVLFSVGNTGAVTAQNSSDSTAAFTISRAGSGGSLLVADTTNSQVQIGSATADATGVVLVLDTKNTSGDPTGASATNGAMYYNSNTNKLRCYQNGTWRDCAGNLQQAYDLSTGGSTPEIKLDTTRGALDIQDADTTIGASLLNIKTSNAAATLLSVGNTGATTFQNSSDSTSAFTISRSGSGGPLFVADTTNSQVEIGSATPDATGVVFILDNKNTAGDPTGVDGAMYYNSNLQAFRCYQAGEWRSCIGGLAASSVAAQTISGTTATDWTPGYTIPANNCVPGRVYRITARGLYTTGLTGGNLTVAVIAGSTTLQSTAVALGGSATNRQWTMNFDVICQTAGSSGTVEADGTFDRFTAANANTTTEMSNTAAVTLNTTISQLLKVRSTASQAGTTTVVRQVVIESLGP